MTSGRLSRDLARLIWDVLWGSAVTVTRRGVAVDRLPVARRRSDSGPPLPACQRTDLRRRSRLSHVRQDRGGGGGGGDSVAVDRSRAEPGAEDGG